MEAGWRIVLVFGVVAMLSVPGAVGAQNAEAEGDAPGTESEARTLPPGAYFGAVSKDDWDYYRMPVPAGSVGFASFTLVSGHSWTDLAMTDSGNSSRSVYVDSGKWGLIRPEGDAVILRVDGFWGSADYEFTIDHFDPNATDPGYEGDASDSATAARLLPVEGEFSGQALWVYGDRADWFRIEPPVDQVVDLRVTKGSVTLHDAQGRAIETVRDGLFTFLADGGAYFLSAGDLRYAFALANSKPADVAPAILDVREVPLSLAGEGTDAATSLDVTVEVGNVGLSPTRDAKVTISLMPSGGAGKGRVADEFTVRLEAGAASTNTLRITTVGLVGDFDLVVRASALNEVNLHNNADARPLSFHAGGAGLGIDPLNQRVRAGDSEVETYFGNVRTGASAQGVFVGLEHGTVTLP